MYFMLIRRKYCKMFTFATMFFRYITNKLVQLTAAMSDILERVSLFVTVMKLYQANKIRFEPANFLCRHCLFLPHTCIPKMEFFLFQITSIKFISCFLPSGLSFKYWPASMLLNLGDQKDRCIDRGSTLKRPSG